MVAALVDSPSLLASLAETYGPSGLTGTGRGSFLR